eukprot:4611802-Pyramimonas_sp.AAC.1
MHQAVFAKTALSKECPNVLRGHGRTNFNKVMRGRHPRKNLGVGRPEELPAGAIPALAPPSSSTPVPNL